MNSLLLDIEDYQDTKDTCLHLDQTLYDNDKTLSVNDMFYLTELRLFGEEHADKMMLRIISNRTLRRLKNSLVERGKMPKPKEITPEEAKELTIQLSHKGNKCEWCGQECYTLHKHHYPIPAHKGGTETVNICPNCHQTFHSLMGHNAK